MLHDAFFEGTRPFGIAQHVMDVPVYSPLSLLFSLQEGWELLLVCARRDSNTAHFLGYARQTLHLFCGVRAFGSHKADEPSFESWS